MHFHIQGLCCSFLDFNSGVSLEGTDIASPGSGMGYLQLHISLQHVIIKNTRYRSQEGWDLPSSKHTSAKYYSTQRLWTRDPVWRYYDVDREQPDQLNR